MVKRWRGPPIFKNNSEIKQEFEKAYSRNEIYVQTVHYGPLLAQNRTGQLRDLIKHMKSRNVYFTSFEEIIHLLEEDKISFNGDKWVVSNS